MDASRAGSGPAASKLLVIAGALYIVNVFAPWQRLCLADVGCASQSGLSGFGALNLILAIGLVAWEGLGLAGIEIEGPRPLVSAALAGALLVFTILKVLADLDHIFVFAGVGLVLALVIGYGGWQRWREYAAGRAGAAPPEGGGSI